MDYFWGNLFEYFRERRTAGVFFGSLLVFFGTIIGGTLLYQVTGGFLFLQYWPMFLPGLVLVLLAIVWRWFRLRRARRSERYKASPLSQDEWVKARRKLAARPMFKK
jgi:MFS family permease